MKNKKGFTLIELLAVLVVLAILALISIPITIRIINNARENSYKRSIASYGRAVESYLGKYLTEHDVDYKNIQLSDIETNISNGNNVICTSLSFQDNGDIVLRGCHVNNSKVYKYINRNVIEDKYEVGDLITVNGIDFYVIEESGSEKDYVTALKKYPLSKEEVTHYGSGYINKYASIPIGEPSTSEEYGAVAYYSDVDCGYGYGSNYTDSGCKTSYDDSDVKKLIDAWGNDKVDPSKLKEIDGYKYRLLRHTAEELSILGYSDETYNTKYLTTDKIPEWVYKSDKGYWMCSWTMTKYWISNKIISIDFDSRIRSYDSVYSSSCVVRPVINVYKDKID